MVVKRLSCSVHGSESLELLSKPVAKAPTCSSAAEWLLALELASSTPLSSHGSVNCRSPTIEALASRLSLWQTFLVLPSRLGSTSDFEMLSTRSDGGFLSLGWSFLSLWSTLSSHFFPSHQGRRPNADSTSISLNVSVANIADGSLQMENARKLWTFFANSVAMYRQMTL